MKYYMKDEKKRYKEISKNTYDEVFKINAPLLIVSIWDKNPNKDV